MTSALLLHSREEMLAFLKADYDFLNQLPSIVNDMATNGDNTHADLENYSQQVNAFTYEINGETIFLNYASYSMEYRGNCIKNFIIQYLSPDDGILTIESMIEGQFSGSYKDYFTNGVTNWISSEEDKYKSVISELNNPFCTYDSNGELITDANTTIAE
jgi:hypothetical protein